MSNCAACGVGLPPAARFCPACGAPAEAARPTEERKLVTILFADLVGSTAYASEEDPERVRSFLDSFYRAMAEEAEAAGGTVEKFAGDAVLAAFGAWTAHEDHPERALHAALPSPSSAGRPSSTCSARSSAARSNSGSLIW